MPRNSGAAVYRVVTLCVMSIAAGAEVYFVIPADSDFGVGDNGRVDG